VGDLPIIAVAYYRRSAQDRRANSAQLQREQVRKWAAAHGITIIKEFADHGKSGLSTEHRDSDCSGLAGGDGGC
jgi:DNA invertase Pin-like site-specific DNA recombinase